MLTVTNVTKAFGATRALDDVSFSIDDGEIVALLGPNGAGKSTLVSILSGLVHPDAGTVTIEGAALHAEGSAARAHLGVAAQEIALVQSLSVHRNLAFFGALAHVPQPEVDRRIADLASDFDLLPILDKKVLLLSGGQKRRVHVAAAVVGGAKVLLLDEPTAGSDLESRDAILRRVLRERDDGRVILYTTHAMEEVTALGARVVIIDGGRLIADSPIDELLAAHTDTAIEMRFADTVPRIPARVGAVIDGTTVRVTTNDPARTMGQLLRYGARSEIVGIDVVRPGLESAFLSLTGRRYAVDEGDA